MQKPTTSLKLQRLDDVATLRLLEVQERVDFMVIIRLNRGHIKELAEVDAEAEHSLMVRYVKPTMRDHRERLVKRFNEGHEMFFGYKEDGILKGYITLKPFFPGHKHCEIYWLSIRKQYQGQRIGTKLISFVEKLAKRMGFRKIFLYTGKAMDGERKFYGKKGFRFINEFPGYYGFAAGPTTAVLYGKEL